MYNEILKKRYIKEKSESVMIPPNYLECQFNKTKKYEEELNKDLHDFTACQIIEYYKILNISSLDSLVVMNSHFSLYTQWCLQEDVVADQQNHFLELDMETLKECLNKEMFQRKIVSRKQVLSWCDQLPNPKDQLVILGLFEGMKGKDFCDFVHLKPSNVIDDKFLSLSSNRTIMVSDRLIRYIKDSIIETIYYSSSGLQVKKMPLINKGYVIKDYPNTKEDTTDYRKGRTIYNGIARSLNYVGVLDFMSANSICESGKLHMIKQRASELDMTPKEYIYSEHIKEVEYQYNCNIVKSIFWLKYEDYLSN